VIALTSEPSIGDLAFRLLGSLAVVVGLMLLIARGVNRRFKAPTGAAVQVVHRQAIGRGQGVAVVSVGTRVLVLGTTEHQVTLLAEVEPEEVGIDVLGEEDLEEGAPEDGATGGNTGGVPTPFRTMPGGALAGSVLSPQTWKQTLAAVTGKRAS
jgi:flagellar protein FliO/FliZ